MSNPLEMNASCPRVMTVQRAGSGITPAPDGIASGPFLIQMLLSSCTEGEMTAMRAFVEPGVITHWHSHPSGQILFVLDGVGIAQRTGGDVIEVRAGDCIWFAAGERHWHGAAPKSPFSYVSVQPVKDGTAVNWFEPIDTRGNHS